MRTGWRASGAVLLLTATVVVGAGAQGSTTRTSHFAVGFGTLPWPSAESS